METATLEGLRVRLNTPSVGAAGGKGTLDVSATLRDASIKALQAGAPLRFSTEWQFAADRFSLHKTKLDAPGIALSGTLDALPAKRRLDGGFRLAVTDWAALSSLTGVPLDGSAAVANVSFSQAKTQQLAADWSFGALSAGSLFSMRTFKGNLRLDDLFGKQGIDGDTAQVGPGVADWLGMPCIAYARKIEIADGQARVERNYEDGYEKLAVALPCALTVVKEANVPRMASLRGKMAAKKLNIVPLTAEASGADLSKLGLSASPTRVVKIFSPPPKTGGVKWQNEEPAAMAQKLVDLLKERKLV